MKLGEFDIIKKYFDNGTLQRDDVVLGIGDDAAIVSVPHDYELVITTDTLIAGVHFPENTLPFDIGYKALAVNLSDLAAMGATPAWITLALTLPNADQQWLNDFARGLFTLAQQYKIQLIGGDTTRGALSITIQAHGLIPKGMAIRRDGAKPMDLIYVSNTVGDAGLALKSILKNVHIPSSLTKKLNTPQPQILLGEKLRGIASAAIDISDGLVADLNHILKNSKVGADVNINSVPLSKDLCNATEFDETIALALTAGDDYELCFTVPKDKTYLLKTVLKDFSYTCIGVITNSLKLNLHFNNGEKYDLKISGYQHF